MRRRQPQSVPESPARLRAFDPADWLPLVDLDEYDPEAHRCRNAQGPYGPPMLSRETWAVQQARALWGRARCDWREEHGGWPGGVSPLDLLRQEMAQRRRGGRSDDAA